MKLLLIGNGGHFNSVLDSLDENINWTSMGNFDIETLINNIPNDVTHFHICVGDIETRDKIISKLNQSDLISFSIIDHSAIISKTAKIESGCFVGKGVVINANAIIGKNNIINTGAIIEHDCCVGNNNHIAPRSTLLGTVKVHESNFIGAGTIAFPNIEIGSNNIIGANSLIRSNITSNSKIYGVYNGK